MTTSTYGLGRPVQRGADGRDGKKGQGNPYYGDTAADLFEPFAEEFDLIANLYARRLRLSLAAPEGVRLELRNDYPVEAREGFPGDPAAGPAARRRGLGADRAGAYRADRRSATRLQVLQAGVTGATPDGVPIAFPETKLALNAVTPAEWEALPADPLVAARVAELEAAALLAQARAAAEHGDWKAIGRMLAEAQRRFAGHPWLIEVLAQLAGLAKSMDAAGFRKEAMYSGRRFHSRVSSKAEPLGDLAAEAERAEFRPPARGAGQGAVRQATGRPGEGRRQAGVLRSQH